MLVLLYGLLYLQFLPLGLVVGILWLWIENSLNNDRNSLKINFGITISILLWICFNYISFFYQVYPNIYPNLPIKLNNLPNFNHIISLVSNKTSIIGIIELFRTGFKSGIIPLQGITLATLMLQIKRPLANTIRSIKSVIQNKSTKLNKKLSPNLHTSNLPPPVHFQAGVMLGIDASNTKQIIIDDNELNGHVLVCGTTGSGKTVTLKNFIKSAIERNIPLIYVDGKADQRLPTEIAEICKTYNRQFKLFEMEESATTKYNPLATGSFTELKDKIITMKTIDSSDGKFYQTAEGEYLQFLFKVMKKANLKIDLYTLGTYISMPKLFELISQLNPKEVDLVELQTEARDIKDRLHRNLDGIISDVNTFTKSTLGHLFDTSDVYSSSDFEIMHDSIQPLESSPMSQSPQLSPQSAHALKSVQPQQCPQPTIINLEEDIKSGCIIYFSLNDLTYPDYASRLGRLIINDIKSVFGRISENNPLKTFAIFDEFTTYAGEQFTTILSRTRSKGVHAIIGTQSFDTIEKMSPKLASDLIANCNTFIVHRQNSDIDAEKLTDVIGKITTYDISYHAPTNNPNVVLPSQKDALEPMSSLTYRKVRENKVNPEKIQALKAGEAYVLRKKSGATINLVKINYIK
jgi:conjugal transfer pilus assembly protein TraD